MTRVLLTGATGFIGGHVAWALLSKGYEVRAYAREGRTLPWQHDSLSYATGDVRDRDAVRAAIDGCGAVIHTAALYALWSPRPADLYDVNVAGTRNVLEESVAAGIQRIVHTSTVGTVAFRSDRLATESDLASPRQMSGLPSQMRTTSQRALLNAPAAHTLNR